MPPKPKLQHGQISSAHIQALEDFLREHDASPNAVYKQLVDPASLRRAGFSASRRLPCPVPEFTLLVDTAEQNHIDLVHTARRMNVWAVAHCLRRAVGESMAVGDVSGDFAIVQYVGGRVVIDDEDDDGDDDDGGEDATAPNIPCGYIPLIDAERKTIPDLIASVKDKRLERQKRQMEQSAARRHVFIVEGIVEELANTSMASWTRAVNTTLDHATWTGTMYVRNISSSAGLASCLVNGVRYVAKEVLDERAGIKHYIAPTFSGKDTGAVAKMGDPLTVYSGTLQRVPGVSPAAAQAIIDTHFPTALDFFRALIRADESPEERETLVKRLSDTLVPSTNSLAKRTGTHLRSKAKAIVSAFAPKREVTLPAVSSAPARRRVVVNDEDDDSALVVVHEKPRTTEDVKPLWDESDASSSSSSDLEDMPRKKRAR